MATKYGSTWTGTETGGSATRKFRPYIVYTFNADYSSSQSRLAITEVGIQKYSSGSTHWGSDHDQKVTVSDGGYNTTKSVTKNYDFDWGSGSQIDKAYITSDFYWYYDKQSTEYTVTITFTGKKASGAWKGNSSGSFTITIPARQNEITISFSGNGGSGSMPSITAYEGQTITLPYSSFTKTGESFESWNTSSYGWGTRYAAGSTMLVPASNVTLYAQWISGYSAPQIKNVAAYRVSSSASGQNPQSMLNGTRGFMKASISGGEGYQSITNVSIKIGGYSASLSYSGGTYYGYTSNGVLSTSRQYQAVFSYTVITDSGLSLDYSYTTTVTVDQYVFDIAQDGKSITFNGEAQDGLSSFLMDIIGTLRASEIKVGDKQVSLTGHQHVASDITDLSTKISQAIASSISGFFTVTNTSILSESTTIAAGGYLSATTYSLSSPGSNWKAIAIAGHHISNYRIRPTNYYISGTSSIYLGYHNDGTSDVKPTCSVDVLWIRTS